MKIHTEYYFAVDSGDALLRNNERFRFILDDFESEELALDAMRKLGEMFEEIFPSTTGYNCSLELRKKIRIEREILMSKLVDHAKKELDLIGMAEDSDGMNLMMYNSIIELVKVFSDQKFSGFSASYAISCLEKLLRFEPISPLTGEDWEWNEAGDGLYQNNRCSRVFKNTNMYDGQPYDINGKVFVEHYYNKDGEERTTSYANGDSHVVISFPYTPKTEYVDVGFVNETI